MKDENRPAQNAPELTAGPGSFGIPRRTDAEFHDQLSGARLTSPGGHFAIANYLHIGNYAPRVIRFHTYKNTIALKP